MKTGDKAVIEFEKKHGSIAFLKVCVSAICQTLEKKGLVTEEELKEPFLKTLQEHSDVLKGISDDSNLTAGEKSVKASLASEPKNKPHFRTAVCCKEGGWWMETQPSIGAHVKSSTGQNLTIYENPDGSFRIVGNNIKIVSAKGKYSGSQDGWRELKISTDCGSPHENMEGD